MKNSIALAAAAAVSLVCAQPLMAQTQTATTPAAGGGFGHHAMHAGFSHFGMLLKSANLTTAQQEQVRQILEANKAQAKSLFQQLRAVREQIATKLLATSVTAADLAPLQQRLTHIQQLVDQDMIDKALAIRNILTPDQVAHLAQVHQQLQGLHAQLQNLMGPGSDEMAEPSN
jgi:Spy/CpxP family protein refolding chaperone